MSFVNRALVLEDDAEAGRSIGTFATLVWTVPPYLAIALLIVSLIWYYKAGQYSWISRSSNRSESAILRWFSPIFHFDILFVKLGHVSGLLVPKTVTETLGVSEEMYYMGATVGDGIMGPVTVIGLLGLLYRRIFAKSVRLATTRMDAVTYVLLCPLIALGAIVIVMHQALPSFSGHGYDYRETVSVWSRSILMMSPKPECMLDVPLTFQMHIIAGIFSFCVWPFMRFMYVASAPPGYITRPSITHRSRDMKQSVGRKRGW